MPMISSTAGPEGYSTEALNPYPPTYQGLGVNTPNIGGLIDAIMKARKGSGPSSRSYTPLPVSTSAGQRAGEMDESRLRMQRLIESDAEKELLKPEGVGGYMRPMFTGSLALGGGVGPYILDTTSTPMDVMKKYGEQYQLHWPGENLLGGLRGGTPQTQQEAENEKRKSQYMGMSESK